MLVIVMLAQTGTNGAKLLLALFAIDLGASPLQVGITFAMFSILPAILAISAGRWVDRIGVRQTVNKSIEVTVPVCFGALAVIAALAPLAVALGTVLAVGAVVIGRDARRRRLPPSTGAPQDSPTKVP
jgi:MFS family permease